MNRIIATLFLMSITSLAFGHDGKRVIHQGSELVDWCKSEAQARYIAKNITPYQWSASYHDQGNVLYVDGRVRVHDNDVTVRCRIASGAQEQYATIEIDDPSL